MITNINTTFTKKKKKETEEESHKYTECTRRPKEGNTQSGLEKLDLDYPEDSFIAASIVSQ